MNNQHKKTKSAIAMALALFMLVSMLAVAAPVKAAGNATLEMVPSTPINLTYPATLPIGSTFTVQVNIHNGAGVWGDNIGMSWTPSILNCTKVQKGTYLSNVGDDASPATAIDNVAGNLPGGFADVLLSSDSASGDGTLCTVTFKVVGFGSGSITITSARLLDATSQHNQLPMDTTIPYSIPLNNPTPPPSAPTAAFTVSATPATIDGLYLTIPSSASSTGITLDASTSGAGFDGLHSVPVNNWAWTIHSVGSHFTDIVVANSLTVALTNVVADDIVVTLTVTASETNPPTGYVDTAQVSRTYHVLQAASSGIDIITQKGGAGPNTPSGPFGPQQNIVVTASVIFNGAPVAQKDIAFSVYTNNGTFYASYTNRTNANGQCSVSFRLLTSDISLDSMFGGNWTVIATVDVAQVSYSDSLKFTFNYLANVATVTASPSSVVRGAGTITIDATISTITAVPGAVVTFTVVDVNNVPVAAAAVQPALLSAGSTVVSQTLNIPNYAFCGQAKIYVNVLSNYPTLGGLPYCPQNGAVVVFNGDGIFVSSTQNPATSFQISLA